MPTVIYLTGAPAAGKSTTTRSLVTQIPDLQVWEYGARLTEYAQKRTGEDLKQEQLRQLSASIVTPEDVTAVDEALLAFVAEKRKHHDVIIDSHPVTKESY